MVIRIEPDYIYDPDEWDVTYPYSDRDMFENEIGEVLSGNEVKKYKTLVEGPDRFLASIVMSYDEDDQPDEIEYKWFDTEEEAIKAITSTDNPPAWRPGLPGLIVR